MIEPYYFEKIDEKIKAYILGLIVFNISDICMEENNYIIMTKFYYSSIFSQDLIKEFNKINFIKHDNNIYILQNNNIIDYICKQIGATSIYEIINVNISYFIYNNDKEYAIEFLKAYFESRGKLIHNDNNNDSICYITSKSIDNLNNFAKFFDNIPFKTIKLANIYQLTYENTNILDLLGVLYKIDTYSNISLYNQFLLLLNNERPMIKYLKTSKKAITPTKANYSDVGYDLSIIGVSKTLTSNVSLYNTGIKLEIPLGYYVELVPRSSISKSGYMLANSIGIIDCSYKGELLVALAKINNEMPDIIFPFRCCQIILKKQLFPELCEISELSKTKRDNGGFGSS